MAFTEKITLMVDVVTGGTRSAFSGIKSDMAQADGAFKKMKVGAAGAFDAIKSMGPVAFAAAGVAVAGFATKAVNAFKDTALAAGEFADASGMGVEDASKWLEVADHIDVSEGAISSAFRRMGVAIGKNSAGWTDLGIQQAKNADGSINLSETFLRVVDALNSMEDPTKRAAAAQKLFGKGFSEVAELIGKDADKLREELGDVGDAKIIDEGELRKAREFRGQMDDLGDAAQELMIDLGGALIPMFTRFADTTANLIETARELGDVWDLLGKLALGAGGEVNVHTAAMKDAGSAAAELDARLNALIAREQGLTSGQALALKWEGQAKAAALASAANAGAEESFADMAVEAEAAANKVDAVRTAYDLLRGALSVEEAQLSLDDQFAVVEEAAREAFEAVSTGAADADEKVRNHAQEVNTLKQRVVDYGDGLLGLPPEVATEILTLIDEGKLVEADRRLDKVAADRTAALKAQATAVPAAERAFANAARTRVAVMTARAEKGAAEGSLNSTARNRTSTITANANTGNAENRLAFLARSRQASINVGVTGAGGLLFRQEGGPIPGGKSQGVPVMAHGGEYVLSADVVDRIKRGATSEGAAVAGGSGALRTGSGGGAPIVVHFHGPVLGTKAEFGRYIDEALAESRRRGFRVA